MTRIAAFRSSAFFIALTTLFGAVGLGSQAAAAEAMFMISGSLAALMAFFAFATPEHAAVPVRVRRHPAHR